MPTGLLPQNMPISEFTRLAETRLRTLPKEQYQPCYLFKTQLLTVLANESTPSIQAAVRAHSGLSLSPRTHAGQTKEVVDKLPSISS